MTVKCIHISAVDFYVSAHLFEGGNMKSGCDICGSVCLSVCDSVRDNPRSSGTAEARDFKFCVHIEG